jgi:trimeric autotransporter adhesin
MLRFPSSWASTALRLASISARCTISAHRPRVRPVWVSPKVSRYESRIELGSWGWSANAFGIIQSGYPLSVTEPNNNSVIGASYQRSNATGIPVGTSDSDGQRLNDGLNPAAFSQAPRFTFGDTSPFLAVRGPGLFNWDLSVFKSFAIEEWVNAQFRAEAFNATNSVYFGTPNTTFTSSTFGVITSQANTPRMLLLGVRATF